MAKFEPINRHIVVDRERFLLVLYQRPEGTYRFKRFLHYRVAIGQTGYETPRGLYLINTRVKYPDWLVPNSQWALDAGLVPGTIIEGGSEYNPLKERWLGVTDPIDGVGIHGTAARDSIKTPASHGCIRMLEEDIVELYDEVPKYTPIYII